MSLNKVTLLTGGIGFIGSHVYAALKEQGREVVIIDSLTSEEQWSYFEGKPPSLISPQSIQHWLDQNGSKVEAVVHLGAITSTTAQDVELVWENNVYFSQRLWKFCADKQIPFIYASSAATYGAARTPEEYKEYGKFGGAHLDRLQPLNLYGRSKHTFDMWVIDEATRAHAKTPSQWIGLKFFNVYGPHEEHKGSMGSVIRHFYQQYTQTGKMKLFRSLDTAIADGEQKRDFVWVKDITAVILWILGNSEVNGLFNLGSGQARTFLDVANIISLCAKKDSDKEAYEFIDMPSNLREQYQDWTQADLSRLREHGYTKPMTTLEDGIQQYIEYLKRR